MTGFDGLGLDPRLLRSLKDMGFTEPFPIQERAIGPILEGIDVIGQAKTGSGKTAAFGLPLLQMVDPRANRVQALILAPTRELAVQITEELRRLGKYMGVRMVTVYGGQSINVQLEELADGADIVVGTPGRIIDFIDHNELNLGSVKYVVLDEADRMLDMGFIDDIEYILEAAPGRRQMSLFSATMPEEIIKLSSKYMSQPEKILVSADEPSVDELDQYYTLVEDGEKLPKLVALLKKENPASAMIFCRTKAGAHRLARELEKRFFNVTPLHGDLSQYQRDRSMEAFRKGKVDILVATDVAARGIDVPGVQLVVNYDFPEDPLIYFHRVGRTARAGSLGKSVALISPDDFTTFRLVQDLTKVPIKPLSPSDENPSFIGRPRRQGYRGGGGRRDKDRRGGYRQARGGGHQGYRRRIRE
ncbi:MAG TPA: DEAD/DEAH box helicase [Conexivisphaerales archaeon]|nr:DEAD/DEAH box helicase [Conexivisphaerales archaeon]